MKHLLKILQNSIWLLKLPFLSSLSSKRRAKQRIPLLFALVLIYAAEGGANQPLPLPGLHLYAPTSSIPGDEEYEKSGDYRKALAYARNNYQKYLSENQTKEAEALVSTIIRLEEKLMHYGNSHLVVDENFIPRPKLLKLFEILGMGSLDAQTSLEAIHEWAKTHLMRINERWEQQTTKFDHLKDQLVPLLIDLGFIEGTEPSFKEYRGAVIHGALLKAMRSRLNTLISCWNKGVRFQNIYFLTGDRPLVDQYENESIFLDTSHPPLNKEASFLFGSAYPKTEYELAELLWKHSIIPSKMRESTRIYFIKAPMKYDLERGKIVRPDTKDTIQLWLKIDPPLGSYLAISNAPYINRQDYLIQMLGAKNYHLETVGSGIHQNEKISIILDEVASLIRVIESKKRESSL